MLKTVTREITLFVQARSGLSTSAAVSAIVIVAALLVAFAFLSVAAYAWLAIQFGTVFAGLIMAGVFVVIAIIAAIVCAPFSPERRGRILCPGSSIRKFLAPRSKPAAQSGGSASCQWRCSLSSPRNGPANTATNPNGSIFSSTTVRSAETRRRPGPKLRGRADCPPSSGALGPWRTRTSLRRAARP